MSKKLWCTLSLALASCAGAPDSADPVADAWPGGKSDTSNQATILDFEWSGTVQTNALDWGGERAVMESLLYYTVGELNGSRSVGRMDRVEYTSLTSAPTKDGRVEVSYHAKMPVAWGSKDKLPKSYTFKLPKNVDQFDAFTTKYKGACSEETDEGIDVSSMWYYYRPSQSSCKLDDADVVRSTAKVTVSTANTTGKYPEYDKVWEDNTLRVVAIFGKFAKGDTDKDDDAGINAFNQFNSDIRDRMGSMKGLVTIPADAPTQPGANLPDVEFQATLADGRSVIVNALLVDEVSSATQAFYDRYEALSTRADFIAYNGHAGLGANIRTLASKGKFVAGQYVIVFMNGCDTYTYVDGALAEMRATLNPDDPTGTKFMDFALNAEPAFFASDSGASMAFINGLLSYDKPLTYEQILSNIDTAQVVLVSGEQDNTFKP